MSVVSQTLFLCGRVLRNLSRQPIWIVVMIVQPMFWLLLYSQLFRRITELPGFGTTSYIDYLTPGIAVMTAFFSGSWAGMGMIEDLDRGVSAEDALTRVDPGEASVRPDTSLRDALSRMLGLGFRSIAVTDEHCRLLGEVTFASVEAAMSEGDERIAAPVEADAG